MIDSHIHLQGNYKIENLERIVKIAISKNLEEIWLLDHTYCFKEFKELYETALNSKDYDNSWLNNKFSKFSLSDYLDLIKLAKTKNFKVKIKFGLEVCYFKEQEKFIKTIKDTYNFDFLIGSIHFVDNFAFGRSKPKSTSKFINNEYLVKRYYELETYLIKSNLFDVVAHPDLIKVYANSNNLDKYYKKIVKVLKKSKTILENNSGVSRTKNYKEVGLNNKFLKLAKDKNIKIITSSDSHEIEDIGDKINELNIKTNINLIKYNKKYLEDIIKLEQQEWGIECTLNKNEYKNKHMILAILNGKLVAIAYGFVEIRDFHLETIIVDSNYQNNKIGSFLLSNIILLAKEKKLDKIKCEGVLFDNQINIKPLMKKYNFIKQKEIKKYWGSKYPNNFCNVCSSKPCVCTAVLYSKDLNDN